MNTLKKFLDEPIEVRQPNTLLERVIYEKARRYAAKLDTVPNLNTTEAFYMGGLSCIELWSSGVPYLAGLYVVKRRLWGRERFLVARWNGSTWNIWGKVLRFKPFF